LELVFIMHIVCSDLEGVFIPEIWINVAQKTGIAELRFTTRDIPDYDALMHRRLAILKENGLKIGDIQAVIATMEPLPGAVGFLDWIRRTTQIIVVSDTFVQFAAPMMQKLGWPTLFCHRLEIALDGSVTNYRLRQKDAKRHAIKALKTLNYQTIGIGDSYNDISMLQAADVGILFRPPANVVAEYPTIPATHTYDELRDRVEQALGKDEG
jgi:phosphoserine/homoserine phosphotransferase